MTLWLLQLAGEAGASFFRGMTACACQGWLLYLYGYRILVRSCCMQLAHFGMLNIFSSRVSHC
jgi:hypothetical protein